MAAPPRVVVGTPAFEAGQIREEIENLELLHTRGRPAGHAGRGRASCSTTPAATSRRLRRHEVVFPHRPAADAWALRWAQPAWPTSTAQSAELAEAAALVVIDVGQPAAENLAVTALRSAEPVVTVGRQRASGGRAEEFRPPAREPGRRSSCSVDGRRAAAADGRRPAGGEAAGPLLLPFRDARRSRLEVRAAGDGLELDNHRYLVVPVRQSLRRAVHRRPAFRRAVPRRGRLSGRGPGAARPATWSGRWWKWTTAAGEARCWSATWPATTAVFLANVAQFTASEARVLDAYLGHGGSLVFFLGDQVLADRYNRELGGGRAADACCPPGCERSITLAGHVQLDPLGYRHPIVQPFRGQERPGC